MRGQWPALPALAGEGSPQSRGISAGGLVLEGAHAVHVGRGAALDFPALAPVLLVLLVLALGEELLVGGLLLVEPAEETDVLREQLREVHLLARLDPPVEGRE